jgi:large subunit ribosomal protein L22
MAFGLKTNERPGVRAEARYIRVSAYKAREVLDLIRGEHVARALEILEFSERDVANPILKCLESAVANAEHNNSIPADELYVSACFADEGPTLKRWRPRARGRATRIRKRTCHITIIVSRLSPDELERMREREATSGRAGGNRAAADARRQRVQRSRETKAERRAAEEAEHDEHDHDHDEHDRDEESVAEAAEAAGVVDQQAEAADQADAGEQSAPPVATEISDAAEVEVVEEAAAADVAEQEMPPAVEPSGADEQEAAADEAQGKEEI